MFEMTGDGLTISCDDCVMRRTPTCNNCVVTFLLNDHADTPSEPGDSMMLDLEQVRVVRLLGRAGLVPGLKYQVAG